MAVDFFFHPPTIALPQKQALHRFAWEHIRDPDVSEAIAEEEQYLQFHLEILDKLHFTEAGAVTQPPYVKKVSLTTRAGLIRSSLMIYASIAEAVLLYHARCRGYGLPRKVEAWSLGAALQAWTDASGVPRPELSGIFEQIQDLRKLRNNIHLFKKANDGCGKFRWILGKEKTLLGSGKAILDQLRRIESPPPAA